MVTDKEIQLRQLDVKLAEANLEAESIKGMNANQKLELAKTKLKYKSKELKSKAVDSIDNALGKALGTLDHIVREDDDTVVESTR